MSKVVVTKAKLDALSEAIKSKTSITRNLTIDEMTEAVSELGYSLQAKSVYPLTSSQTVTPDSGYYGLSSVTVNPVDAVSLSVTANGQYVATAGTYYSDVNVDVAGSNILLQAKTVSPTNLSQAVLPDSGYQGLSSVTVSPISSPYADVSSVTASSSDVISGKTFVNQYGESKTGTLVVNSYYIGSTVPDSSLGNDGDLYFRV